MGCVQLSQPRSEGSPLLPAGPRNRLGTAFAGRAAALCAVSLIMGCATVGNRGQYVLVDSVPRGGVIGTASDPGVVIGQTPFVMRMPTASSVELSVLSGDDVSRTATENCPFAWRSMLLGNVPIAAALGPALGGVYFGAAVATDILTDSAYSCPERTMLYLKESEAAYAQQFGPANRDKICRSILAVPPYHISRTVSDRIFAEWQRVVRAQLSSCDTVLPLSETRATLAEVDLTFDKPSVLRNVSRASVNRAALKTGATHLADLDVVMGNDGAVIETTLHEIMGEARTRLKTIRVAELSGSIFYLPAASVLDQTFVFLPNSVAMASLFAFPNFDQNEASYRFYRKDQDRDFKGLLANWELAYVPRLSSYPSGSVRFLSSAALWSQLLQQRMNMYWRFSNVDPKDALYSFRDQLNIWYLGATMENRLYAMLGRFGAPFLGAGLGFSFVSGHLKGADATGGFPLAAGYAGYVIETGRQAFLEVQGGYATTLTPHFETRFTSLTDYYFLRVKAGFYLSAWRDSVRSAF